MFNEDNVDMIIEYILDLTGPELKVLKLLISNGVTPYKALDQVINKREQKIEAYLRKFTSDWKNNILSKSYNVCYITGISRPDKMDVHHSSECFDDIVKRAFNMSNITYREKLKDYNPRELKKLSELIVSLHKGVQGVVMLQEVHQLFHKEYGYNNNIYQLDEFKRRFSSGEYQVNMRG